MKTTLLTTLTLLLPLSSFASSIECTIIEASKTDSKTSTKTVNTDDLYYPTGRFDLATVFGSFTVKVVNAKKSNTTSIGAIMVYRMPEKATDSYEELFSEGNLVALAASTALDPLKGWSDQKYDFRDSMSLMAKIENLGTLTVACKVLNPSSNREPRSH